MRAALVVLLALLAAPAALAQDPWVYPGGEPGVVILAGGIPIDGAAEAANAIRIDPGDPLELSISLSPPEGEAWEVRSISVGLLPNGPGSEPPELLLRHLDADSSIPPGWTVVVNRTLDLAALKKVGAGTFLMEAQVGGADGEVLYERAFYVRVPASLAALATVQGATIAAVSIATGYGFWQIAKDIKELRDAWDRHRKKKELAKLDVIGKAERTLEHVAEKGGKPLASAVGIHRAVQASEKGLRPVRWCATGLGLGGVGVAWLQFLGYIAFDGLNMFVIALEAGAIMLTIALIVNYFVRRARASAGASARGDETALTRSVPVEETSTSAELAHNRD